MRLPSLQHLARTSRPSRTSSRLRPTGNPPNTALSRPALRPYTSAPAEDTDGEEDYDFGAFGVILPEEPYVWGVSHITPRAVPAHIARPPYARGEGVRLVLEDRPTQLGGADERRLREAARLARDVLRFAGSLVEVGVTTDSIDGQLHDYVLSHSAYPSPLLYRGFPRSCCTSINNVVTHGIPDQFNGRCRTGTSSTSTSQSTSTASTATPPAPSSSATSTKRAVNW